MASVAASISMRPPATAFRWVLALPATSTMWAWPWASKWVNPDMAWHLKWAWSQQLETGVYETFIGFLHHTVMHVTPPAPF